MNITKENGLTALKRLREIANEGLNFTYVGNTTSALMKLGWCGPTDPEDRKAAEFSEGLNSLSQDPKQKGWLDAHEVMTALAMIVAIAGVKVTD